MEISFQKDLSIIDSSNLDYKNAVGNMKVYLWAILGVIHLWCPHKGCAWGSDLAEENAKTAVGCGHVKGSGREVKSNPCGRPHTKK